MYPGAAGANVEAFEGVGIYKSRQEGQAPLKSSPSAVRLAGYGDNSQLTPSIGNKITAAERSLGSDQCNCEKGQRVSVPNRAID
jgi:hypothetical protein